MPKSKMTKAGSIDMTGAISRRLGREAPGKSTPMPSGRSVPTPRSPSTPMRGIPGKPGTGIGKSNRVPAGATNLPTVVRRRMRRRYGSPQS